MCCWHDSLQVRALPGLSVLCSSTLLSHVSLQGICNEHSPVLNVRKPSLHNPVCCRQKSVDDILLNFPEHGVHLIFESSSQKLRLIEVYDLSRLQVRLLSHSFGCSSLAPSLTYSLTHSLDMCLPHSCVNSLCTTILLCAAAVCMFHCCCKTKQD